MDYDDEYDMQDFMASVAEDISSHGTYEYRLIFLKRAKERIAHYQRWLKRKIKKSA